MARPALCLVFVALALSWPVATSPQQRSSGATIQGVVRADTGEALAGAEVLLFGPRNAAPPQRTMMPAPSRTTTTDGSGEFSFEDLDPGSYSLRASASGFESRAYGQESRTGGAVRLAVSGSQRIASATIRLPRLGVISGRVFDEQSGEPLQDVPVSLTRAQGFVVPGLASVGFPDARTTTDDRGEYRLHSIPPGRYVLHVGTPVGMAAVDPSQKLAPLNSDTSQGFVVRYFPGVQTLAEAVPVDVYSGAVLAIDMGTYRSPLYSIRGVVEDGTGRPPARVRFQVNGVSLPGQTYDPRTGAFELPNLPVGSYSLVAQSRVLDDIARAVNVDDKLVVNPAAQAVIQITESDVEDLTLFLRRPASVSGRARLDGASGNPPRGVSLFVAPIDTAVRRDSIPRASAGEDGTFIIYGLRDGAYRVFPAVPPGFYVKSIRYGSTDILNGPWQFWGSASGVVEIVLGEGVARITGSVTDARGQPAPGAQIVLVPDERWRTDLVDSSIADQYGRFTLENIPPGDYTLFAWAATEEVEPLNPEYIRQFERLGRIISLSESSVMQVNVRMIP